MTTIYKRLENFTSAELWALRKKVVVNSVYLADFANNYGISEVSLSNFFEGYYDYMRELAELQYGKGVEDYLVYKVFDVEDTLYGWFNCFDDFDWVEYDYDKDVNELAKDLVDGFEDELSFEKIKKIIISILQNGGYTIEKLWNMNIYDSTKVYDLMSNYGDYKK